MKAHRIVLGCSGLVAVSVFAGCASSPPQQSILDPQGERADAVHGLWELMLWMGVAVWVIVTVVLLLALLRRRRSYSGEEKDRGEDDDERRPFWLIAVVGAVVPGIIVGALTLVSAEVLLEIDPEQETDGTLVEVTAHQYWWEVRYPDLGVVTANEIHIPVGEKVRVELTSDDVIHSFWVPQLSGKIDTVPGRSNVVWLSAFEPGTYWGQCAEFCGASHALMRMLVVAHDDVEFAGWVDRQLEPAESAAVQDVSDEIARGREMFMSSSCVYCHSIEGTPAQGEVGPDLTHLAGRETIAAGLLPNDRGNLAGWLLDPQSIKPGNLMPGTDLDGDDLQLLLTYLQSLE